jgi:leucyl-tRNA synthetase
MMILANALEDAQPLPQHAVEILILLLAPFAPHLAEELWQRLGHANSLASEPWPSYDPAVLVRTDILWVVQVNGKVRARITLPAEANEERLRQVVLADERIKKFVNGQPIKQFIVVPNRLVNIVI